MILRAPARTVVGAALVAVTLGLAGCGDGCWGDAPKKPSSASTSAAPTATPATTPATTPTATPSTSGPTPPVGAAAPTPAPAAPPVPTKERVMAKVGDPVPTVRVRDQHGRERSLEEFRGKRVVIWWFPKADTPGWTIEGCGFRDLHAEYTKKNVVLLGASFDTPAENLAFAQKHGYAFDILCDTDRLLGQALGFAADAKATYAKRWTYVISPDGTIEQILDKVDPRNHPAELLKTLP